MTVWIKRSCTNREHYHTDKQCVDYQKLDRTREIAKADAEKIGLDECKRCAGEIKNTDPDWSYYQALRDAATND